MGPDTAEHFKYYAEHCRKAAKEMREMSAAHEQMATQADTFSRGNITVVTVCNAGVGRPGWRPRRNRTAERELGKNILLGSAGRISGLEHGPKYFAYFLPISCTNSRHFQTGQSNVKQLASFWQEGG
jgi:hypothetical protein